MLTLTAAAQGEGRASGDRVQALYVAEAGLSDAIASVESGNFAAGAIGPVALGSASYWGNTVDNGDGSWTLTAFGTADGTTRGLQVLMSDGSATIYDNALFAGNSSGDPSYALEFGGCGGQADEIFGNVYSGGDIDIDCDADVMGDMRAQGVINGGVGIEGQSQPIPDIPGMNYALNHDIDVAAEFAKGSTYAKSNMGGSAGQLPKTNPAHIFRKEPSDRKSFWQSTPQADYFLEDPYESKNTSTTINPAGGAKVSIAGAGNEAVYYIEGNLWVHNLSMYSFTFAKDTRITIVVKGNIYISDNLFYDDQTSGLALIAIKDDAYPGESGDIYFGDPEFGTLEYMDSFMYAENNFYDNNLDAAGSKTVTVNGNMTAGNQVLIKRDFGNQHSKLTVKLDDRIMEGELNLPGLPTANGGGAVWNLSDWHEIAAP